jgi:hypothetical protein
MGSLALEIDITSLVSGTLFNRRFTFKHSLSSYQRARPARRANSFKTAFILLFLVHEDAGWSLDIWIPQQAFSTRRLPASQGEVVSRRILLQAMSEFCAGLDGVKTAKEGEVTLHFRRPDEPGRTFAHASQCVAPT